MNHPKRVLLEAISFSGDYVSACGSGAKYGTALRSRDHLGHPISEIQPQDSSTIPAMLALGATPSLGSTFGAIMLSTFFSLMLYGLTAHQTFRYFRMYRGDVPFFKILVFAIFYYYFVVNYFNPLAFIVSIWSIQALPLSTGITVLLTQSFYVRRIYLVDRRYLPIVFLVVSLMLVELGFIIGKSPDASELARAYLALTSGIYTRTAATVTSFGSDTFEGLSGHIWMDTTLFAVAASADLILTGTLVLILRNSYTRFERTNTVLDTLSLYAVIATSLNTALTVPAFVCSLALPQTFVYFAIAMPATKGTFSFSPAPPPLPHASLYPLIEGKEMREEEVLTKRTRAVYSNSVLAVLNCRQALTRTRVGHTAGSSGSSHHRTPVSGLPRSANRSGLTGTGGSVGAGLAQSESATLPSSYAMVRIKMARTGGRGDLEVGEDSESVDAKIRGPERWAVLAQ
ncbi:hypothetical protein V8D89_001619 [Ganoderma adspersum]